MFSFVQKEREKTCFFKNQHGLEGCKVLPKKINCSLSLIFKKWPKLSTFRRKCLQNCQKVMFYPRFLLKWPKNSNFARHFQQKYPTHNIVCVSARGYLRLQDRSRLGARGCLRCQTGRESENALYLNEILHGKPRAVFHASPRSRSV